MAGGAAGGVPQQGQGVAPQANPYGGASMPVDSTNTTTQADMMGRGTPGAGLSGVRSIFNPVQQINPYRQAPSQQAMQQANPYQQAMPQQMQPQMRTPMPQQTYNSYQQQLPQQISGIQAALMQMLGGYNQPMARQTMPQYRSQALSYRPDMTQANAALNRTATSQAEARAAAAEKEAKAKDEAEYQTWLRDQYIRFKNHGYFFDSYGSGG